MEGFHILQLVKTNINMWWMGDSIVLNVLYHSNPTSISLFRIISIFYNSTFLNRMTYSFGYFMVNIYNQKFQELNNQIFLCRIWNTLFVNMRERQYLKYNHLQRMNILEWISIKSEKRDLEHYRDTHFELIVLSCLRQVITRNASYT